MMTGFEVKHRNEYPENCSSDIFFSKAIYLPTLLIMDFNDNKNHGSVKQLAFAQVNRNV